MANVFFERFYGIVPREHPANLDPGHAQEAVDVCLAHGTLRPWRVPRPVEILMDGVNTTYLWGCHWMQWTDCVEIVEWKASCPRLYVTGDGYAPMVTALTEDSAGNLVTSWRRNGVPKPSSALAVNAPPPIDNRTRKDTAYTYTYVNNFCEEGAPGPTTRDIATNDGSSVVLTNFEAPDSEWGVVSMNIYRLETASYDGNDPDQGDNTEFFLVGTVPVGTNSHTDSVLSKDIGVAMSTQYDLPPPDDIRGIVSVWGGRTMAGFRLNEVWFSQSNKPWSWPESYFLALDDNVLALSAGGDGVLHVITDGTPYAITAELPCGDPGNRDVVRHMESLPGVTCCSDKGVLTCKIGTVYVSSEGLVLLQGPAPPQIITSPYFAVDDWRKMRPETMRLGYYAGSVFCISDTHGFILTLNDSTRVAWDTLQLSYLSVRPSEMITGRNGEMFMRFKYEGYGVMSQWDAGPVVMPYKWKSKELQSPSLLCFGAGVIQCEGTCTFTLFADKKQVFTKDAVVDQQYFRMPRYGNHLIHAIQLEGVNEVNRVDLGTSYWDMRNGGGR